MRYQNAENVQFYRCDSRSVDLEKKLNPKIKYYEVKYHLTVGRNTFPRQQGLEKEGMQYIKLLRFC